MRVHVHFVCVHVCVRVEWYLGSQCIKVAAIHLPFPVAWNGWALQGRLTSMYNTVHSFKQACNNFILQVAGNIVDGYVTDRVRVSQEHNLVRDRGTDVHIQMHP